VRKAIVAMAFLGLCVSLSQAEDSLGPRFFESYGSAADFTGTAGSDGSVWNAPDHPVFHDRPLLLKQYGYGVLGSVLAGALGFYIGNAFEGAIFGGDSHKGYLSFSGIRYEHQRGPFWGGGAGVLLGSGLTVFFMGDADEEEGSVWWTMAGGTLTTAAAFYLADVAKVQTKRSMVPFIPLLVLPSSGAVAGYHISRWFNDKKRREITEPAPTSAVLHAPRLGMVPGPDGMILRVDALNLTF
jgi:hypothetical protein